MSNTITWAAINHDLGYKSEFGVPRSVAREFSRIAGLLEIADDEFVRVRDDMKAYTEEIRKKIIENKADEVHIDMISLNEYVKRNGKMQELISLDELNQNFVSVATRKYIEEDGVKYFVGDIHRRAYANSEDGREEINEELAEPYLSAVMTVWGDTPTVVINPESR